MMYHLMLQSRLRPLTFVFIVIYDFLDFNDAQPRNWNLIGNPRIETIRPPPFRVDGNGRQYLSSINKVKYITHPNGHRQVTSIRAHITPDHLGRERDLFRNFDDEQGAYMHMNMNARPGDERGHFIAASLGGTNDLVNLHPQHPASNRNVGHGRTGAFQIFHDRHYNAEAAARKFLRQRTPGVERHIVWKTKPQYGNNMRSNGLNTRIGFYENGILQNHLTKYSFTRNGPTRNGY